MAATIASPKPLPSLERAWSFRLKRSKGAVEEILGEARTVVDHMKFDALVDLAYKDELDCVSDVTRVRSSDEPGMRG
jgi:hypothetical protein